MFSVLEKRLLDERKTALDQAVVKLEKTRQRGGQVEVVRNTNLSARNGHFLAVL